MAYLRSALYGQSLKYAKSVAASANETIIARSAARGIWDIFALEETPVQPGQKEFIIRATDKVWHGHS